MDGLDPAATASCSSRQPPSRRRSGVFYRRHVRGVLAFFRRRVASAELALDLTAETFAAALEASARYEPRPEPARGWLYR